MYRDYQCLLVVIVEKILEVKTHEMFFCTVLTHKNVLLTEYVKI